MAASNILILGATSRRPKVLRLVAVGKDTYVFPMRWLFSRRFGDAQVIDGLLTLSKVVEFRVVGIAGPRALGAPVISYLMLLMIGALTLSIPLSMEFKLEKAETFDIDRCKEYLSRLVNESPDSYTKTVVSDLVARIKRSSSFEQIARSIGRD